MTDKENNTRKDIKDENTNEKVDDSKFDDVQIVGGILLGLIVVIAGIAMFGGGMGEVDDFEYPDWADEDGLVVNDEDQPDTQSAIESHTMELAESSYKLSIHGTNDNPEGGQDSSKLDYKYNSESQTSYGVQEFNEESSESYEDYSRQEQFSAQGLDTDNVTYDRQLLQQPTPFTAGTEFVELLSVLDVEATSTVDDGNVLVYEINGVDEEMEEQVPVDASGEIHLHKEGYFTQIDIEINDEEQGVTTSQEIEISNVGSTSFDEPDWLSNAREETDEVDINETEVPENETELQPTP